MKIKTSVENSIAVIEIEGSLSSDMKFDFDNEISRYVSQPVHIILDLSKVAFVDSAALGSIIKFYSVLRKNGRHLLLSSINQKIYDVFRLTGITRQIKIFESLQNALDYIRENS
ncbi:MAG TPA: STAS domain-containing protein [Spirochaetota bacterium]|nr:STAS domain-containing protein [Spirochaetota bacterium]HPC40033.1 STAS domain-containing protein [Spirochaetota bacterium]HPL15202.1 STAS domain-containing protein [Spirochaetota bacterium]HQF09912.1 STAS domain-containing protein [Spirochaetota bacterium]HQH98563.1 STAS domain-containing protein [Spirochaetota bacterium]